MVQGCRAGGGMPVSGQTAEQEWEESMMPSGGEEPDSPQHSPDAAGLGCSSGPKGGEPPEKFQNVMVLPSIPSLVGSAAMKPYWLGDSRIHPPTMSSDIWSVDAWSA